AKVAALIGRLPPTLQDRSIAIQLERKRVDQRVERRRGDRNNDLLELHRKASRWAADHKIDLASRDPEVPSSLDDRAADNWRSLLAIADAIGGNYPQHARAAASALSGGRDEDEESPGVVLLRDVRRILEGSRAPVEFLTPSRLVEELVRLEEAPWS